jgi:Peptidase family C25
LSAGYERTQNGSITLTNSNVLVTLNFNNNGVPSTNAFLEKITIQAKSFLAGYGKQFQFKVNAAATSVGTGEYIINNASNIGQVWDITDIYNVSSKSNNAQNQIAIKSFLGQAQNFIVVDNNDIYNPINDGRSFIANQDIKGTIFLNKQGVFTDIDYLIVTPASLNNQAERLANFHRNYSNLNVKVINLEGIYEEFCSGKQDIGGIRNLTKYIYDNASAPNKRIKYLCLFGDTSFDYKNRIPNNNNIVPTFHALSSLSATSSFMSDDFFGLMDANEGDMTASLGIDVAVGRMLVSSQQQADQMVTKVIDYHDKKSFGRWRNNLVFLSDDIDKVSDNTIQTDLNLLSDTITNAKPFLNSKKIHIDSYVQETTSGGQKYPKAKEDFINAFDQGALVFNYFGHGGEDGLSAERLFERTDALNLANRYRYPLFITVTCEFSRFDNPFRPTAGEQTFWNPTGGAVAMITTTRLIFQSVGQVFNINLASNLFAYGSSNYTSIAEAVRRTKSNSANSGNNVIFYLGDPALKLAIPKPKVVLTKINNIPVSSATPNIEALSYATLTGEVTDEFNNLLTNYNGELAVNVFDKEINRTTLGNDGTIISGSLSIMPFKTLGETIFRGNASVTNGKFEFGFVVPRDIKIPIGVGKVSFYAKNNAVADDQTGSDYTLKIGGLNVNAVADVTPPQIKLYMNDETFVSGGITNQSPLFLAFLEDENGINTASGIGHDIVAFLDGDETKPYILNDFYETELNNYKKGKLKFPFTKLKPGLHTLTFKAWDVYNNLITSELQFVVVGNENLTLTNVLNYPNPFVNHTEFWFTHNKPFEELEVQIQVFTITGKIVWTKNQIIYNNGFTSRDITWDGRDDFGDKIGKGVYVYKLTVKSNVSDKKIEKIEKLVIL